MAIYEPRCKFSLNTLSDHSDFGLSAFRTTRNKFLLLISHLVYGILLSQPKWIKTIKDHYRIFNFPTARHVLIYEPYYKDSDLFTSPLCFCNCTKMDNIKVWFRFSTSCTKTEWYCLQKARKTKYLTWTDMHFYVTLKCYNQDYKPHGNILYYPIFTTGQTQLISCQISLNPILLGKKWKRNSSWIENQCRTTHLSFQDMRHAGKLGHQGH